MKTAKVITGVIIVLIAALAVGLIFKFTNGFNEEFKTFYLEQDGKQILTSETERSFLRGESYRYEVKYTFDSGKSESKGYNVKVVPNVKFNLTFNAGGKVYSYAEAKELTGAFDIKKEKSAFTLTVPEEVSLKTVLEKAYGKEVEVVEPQGYLYTLVVSSYNEKVTYKINFGIAVKVEGIELDKDGIVFGGGMAVGDEQPNPSPSEPIPDQPETPQPSDRDYRITFYTWGDITNLVPVRKDIPLNARGGETVTFTYEILDVGYEITDMSIFVEKEPSLYVPIISAGGNVYSFVMPESPISLRIQADLIVSETYYTIEIDQLGNGSILSVEIECPSKARAGEEVVFTASVKDPYDEYYDANLEITGIEVRIRSGEQEGEDYYLSKGSDGKYRFAMPDGDITLMFYLMYE